VEAKVKLDPDVEAAQLIVQQTVRLARTRGLTNKEAINETSEILQTTESRIWTLLYRADTLRTVSPGESKSLQNGFDAAMAVYLAAVEDRAVYLAKLADALASEALVGEQQELNFFGSVSRLDRILHQTESATKLASGRPLWRRVVPKKRPRKAQETGTNQKAPVLDAVTEQASLLVQIAVDSMRWL
jgi:hypothetical protein